MSMLKLAYQKSPISMTTLPSFPVYILCSASGLPFAAFAALAYKFCLKIPNVIIANINPTKIPKRESPTLLLLKWYSEAQTGE